MNATQSIRRARLTDRSRNIYSATVAENPRLTDQELLGLIEGRVDARPGADERTRIEKALTEYDRAIDALASGVTPVIAGIELATRSMNDVLQQAIERASAVAVERAPIHSVVNALNITLIGAGSAPVAIQRAATTALLQVMELARRGATEPFELLVRRLKDSETGEAAAPRSDRTERTRIVEEAFASWALEGLLPGDQDRLDAADYVEGRASGSDLVARLKVEYGVK